MGISTINTCTTTNIAAQHKLSYLFVETRDLHLIKEFK